MHTSTIPFLAALAGSTTAQLSLPFAPQSANVGKSSHRPMSDRVCAPDGPSSAAVKRGKYTLVKQDSTVCYSRGEKQWTGTVDVSDTSRLFFWAFESRKDPVNDPVILWINGGPGKSSISDAFTELGPCVFRKDRSDGPEPNPWSWNNNATLVFLDHPAGVGFSSIARGVKSSAKDTDGAQDFQVFLNIFFRDVFPRKAHLPIHIATEKYGGHWVPTYVDHILKSRRKDAPTAFWGNITSMILVNAMVDFGVLIPGFYELLCKDKRGAEIVTAEQCLAILDALPNNKILAYKCAETLDVEKCAAVPADAAKNIMAYYGELVGKGERSPDHLHQPCLDPPECHRPMTANVTEYLNRREVKMRFDFTECFTFHEVNMDLQSAYLKSGSAWVPTTKKVAAILDAYKQPKLVFDGSRLGDVRIMALNGNLDPFVNTRGNIALYDRIVWSGMEEYRIAAWQALNKEEIKATGAWKGTKDGKLVFVAVDDAGGMVPADTPEASYRILYRWLRNEWR